MNAPASTSKLNDGQRAALCMGRDLLVSAGAGAGKTQVLGLRVLAILEEGRATIDQIVAFTFTDKAAAEMRERVQRLLHERITELESANQPERLLRLQRASHDFARNRISTVHAFCYRLLREFAWEAGLEPGVALLDERAQALALETTTRRVLLQTREDDDAELSQALVRLGTAVRLYSLTDTLAWLIRNRLAAQGALQRACDAWAEPDAEVARRRAAYDALLGDSMRAVLAQLGKLNMKAAAKAPAGDKLRETMEEVSAALPNASPRKLAELLFTSGTPKKFTTTGSKKSWAHDLKALDANRAALAAAAQALAQLDPSLLKYDFDEAHERRCGQCLLDLHTVFSRALPAYREACAGGLDFTDLEDGAIRLLQTQPALRAEVCARARYILIDEFQDTNPTQAQLFRLLTQDAHEPGRLFMVGDAKQSIYGFRGSDVRVFNHAISEVPRRNAAVADRPMQLPWGLECADTPERRGGIVRLDHNYRTVAPLLQLGNGIFRGIFNTGAPLRDFDAAPQDMLPGREKAAIGAPNDQTAELHLLQAKRRTGGGTADDPDQPAARDDDEAELAAQRARALHDEGLAWKDIAILARRGTIAGEYRSAFARHGIPLVLAGSRGLLATTELLDCFNLLAALSNPGNDLAVLGLLRSPFASISDRDLTQLALAAKSRGLLQRARDWSDKPAHLADFLAAFDDLRSRAGRESPALLLAEAVSKLGYPLAIGCGHEAGQRLANLERVLSLVRELQRERPSLAALVRELGSRIERGDDEMQGIPDSATDGVRFMTVHGSKGLEFPAVIVPDLGGQGGGFGGPMLRDLPPDDAPQGIWLPSLAEDTRGKARPDFMAWRHATEAAERDAAESRRVLYVAYTRAAERLVLIGSIGDNFEGERWAQQLCGALGITSRDANSPSPALWLHWAQPPQRTEARTTAPHQQRITEALAHGALPLPVVPDASLLGVLGNARARGRSYDPESAEFGTLVHEGIERALRVAGAETGLLDLRQSRHVRHALEALGTLGSARRTLPEYEFMAETGMLRLDLLRELEGDRFEIIDYKTDRIDDIARLATHAESEHGEQLRRYGNALENWLNARGRKPAQIRLLVCFTQPESLQPGQRLVEIAR